MTIHASLMVPALGLLLLPADRLLPARVELRSFDRFRRLENSPSQRPWWWIAALWLDPVRAFAGLLLLKSALGLVSEDPVQLSETGFWCLAATAVVSTITQFPTRRERGVLLAPLGFVAGAVAALVPWPVALLALSAAFVGLFGLRQFSAFFGTGFIALALIGFVLEAPAAWLTVALTLLALPLLAALCTGATLEIPAINERRPAPKPHVDGAATHMKPDLEA